MEEIKAEKKDDEGAKKVDHNPAPVVYKLYLHCEGCVNKVKRIVSQFAGVETVQADQSSNKVTVTGKFDEVKLQDRLAKKTKKKVELILPPPKEDEDAALEKPSDKESDEKKPEENNPNPKEEKPEEKKAEEEKPTKNTVVLKIKLHSEGCITKIENIMKLEEVEMVKADGDKDLVTVKGIMEAKDLLEFLEGKLKRNVDLIPPPPKKEKEKKEKDNGGKMKETKKDNGGEKKSVEVIKHDDAKVKEVEVKKMEYPYPIQPPMYWYHGHVNAMGDTNYSMGVSFQQPGYGQQRGYMNPSNGYPVQHPQLPFYMQPPQLPFYMHPHHPLPQMFSDENPNACSIM